VGEGTTISQIVRYGYARPRDADPEAMLQVTQLIRAGCGSITIETPANANDEAADGNRLTALLQSMEPGGELVIPYVAHVVRNAAELLTLLDHVEAQGQVPAALRLATAAYSGSPAKVPAHGIPTSATRAP